MKSLFVVSPSFSAPELPELQSVIVSAPSAAQCDGGVAAIDSELSAPASSEDIIAIASIADLAGIHPEKFSTELRWTVVQSNAVATKPLAPSDRTM